MLEWVWVSPVVPVGIAVDTTLGLALLETRLLAGIGPVRQTGSVGAPRPLWAVTTANAVADSARIAP
jgi:hypothetical protein